MLYLVKFDKTVLDMVKITIVSPWTIVVVRYMTIESDIVQMSSLSTNMVTKLKPPVQELSRLLSEYALYLFPQ